VKIFLLIALLLGTLHAQERATCYRGVVGADGRTSAEEIPCSQLPAGEFTELSQTAPKSPKRGKKKLLFLAAAVAFELLAAHYDISETEKGLKAGVAVEGNTFLVGQHPSAAALWGRDALMLGITATPSTLAYIFRNQPFYYGGLAALIVLGAKHIQGGDEWKSLLQKASQ